MHKNYKSNLILFVSIFILLISLVILGRAIQIEHRTNVSAPYRHPLSLNKQFTFGSVNLRLDNLSYGASKHSFIAPVNKQYLIINLVVSNRTDRPIMILPASDTYVKDGAGNVIYLTPYELTQPFRAGELLPGDTIQGQLSYLVPKSGKLVYYIDGEWSGGVVPIALN